MLKKVRIRIETSKTELAGSFFEGKAPHATAGGGQPQKSEQLLTGRYHDDGTRVSVAYKESALSGLEGSEAILSFFKNEPGAVSLQRTGSVKTLLCFEAGKRHSCVYQTQIMPFDVCLWCRGVQNRLEQEGKLCLDYEVEVRGGTPERVQMTVTLLPDFDAPQGA